MTYKIGSKGQVVIAKEIRDKLGIGPGWEVVQLLVEDHVELYFVPPVHRRSLKGMLAPYIKRQPETDDWTALREQAWKAISQEKENR
ncbi:AbrB/MazE/SpoVT family DNA-binding domain-containing protein [Rhodothermus marinus]|uniref:Transcriptional regulator, AbrB family n=1 Tax=Rhodothermus marinus (strain ATCC 43812 / DSM 4252 / R-10) TaxID=518766 RepID=D0MIL0_RHOM4|nr:AbrB/MazE/SpoVT family DNA-binding domain-containing protein [Rhodothermus marinus]ACY48318.1 transcriptional regulator, AbrB family [Rhodothermus marinus DSM 4252]